MNNDLDRLFSSFYAAASHRLAWHDPLRRLSQWLQLWAAQIIGMDKRHGGLIFSAGGWGGAGQPEVELDYIRLYHANNPALAHCLAVPAPGWFHCHEVFDERFVAGNPFYQEFLIPHGGRWLSTTKLIDNDECVFLLGLVRGTGDAPLGPGDGAFLAALQHHVSEAMHNHLHVRGQFAEHEMARTLFDQFSYPMLVLDEGRGIWHANAHARDLLAGRDLLLEDGGFLMCATAAANNALTEAVRALDLKAANGGVEVGRRVVTVSGDGRTLRLFVSALQPDRALQMFGATPRFLVIVHDDHELGGPLDPVLIAECFSLTPAEARVAVRLAEGLSINEIATQTGITVATVRTHVQRTLAKTGTSRQSELVRLLLSMPLRAGKG